MPVSTSDRGLIVVSRRHRWLATDCEPAIEIDPVTP
jgi:hypothetical protein